ncbi:alpha/beta fold hydrolase [Streptomyces sp. M19]
MSEWTSSWEHIDTDADGVRLHAVRAGSGAGTPVVLLHGWPQTWYAWRKVIPLLARRHEVYAVDLPGLGESGAAPEGHGWRAPPGCSTRGAARGLERVHVVGTTWAARSATPGPRCGRGTSAATAWSGCHCTASGCGR